MKMTSIRKRFAWGLLLLVSHAAAYAVGSSFRYQQTPSSSHPILSNVGKTDELAEYFLQQPGPLSAEERTAAIVVQGTVLRALQCDGLGPNARKRLQGYYDQLGEKTSS